MKGFSREKLYQELGLESLEMPCCYRKLFIIQNHKEKYPL